MFKIFKFKKVNEDNSTIGTQCVASGKCRFRFTEVCKNCKNNIGMEEEDDYFENK